MYKMRSTSGSPLTLSWHARHNWKTIQRSSYWQSFLFHHCKLHNSLNNVFSETISVKMKDLLKSQTYGEHSCKCFAKFRERGHTVNIWPIRNPPCILNAAGMLEWEYWFYYRGDTFAEGPGWSKFQILFFGRLLKVFSRRLISIQYLNPNKCLLLKSKEYSCIFASQSYICIVIYALRTKSMWDINIHEWKTLVHKRYEAHENEVIYENFSPTKASSLQLNDCLQTFGVRRYSFFVYSFSCKSIKYWALVLWARVVMHINV